MRKKERKKLKYIYYFCRLEHNSSAYICVLFRSKYYSRSSGYQEKGESILLPSFPSSFPFVALVMPMGPLRGGRKVLFSVGGGGPLLLLAALLLLLLVVLVEQRPARYKTEQFRTFFYNVIWYT